MLTFIGQDDIILFVSERYMQRYRSGHNEAVLKTVCPQGRVGSNPTLSALTACRIIRQAVIFLS